MARTNNKDVHRGVVLYLDGKEIPNNARAIRAEMKKVRTEIDGMTRGTEEYNRASKKIRTLDAALQHHRAQLKSVEMAQESLFAKGKRWLKDYSVALITTFEALTGVAMQLNKFRKMAAEQEDAAANLKALTGLDDDNIAWLKQQAEMLSTTMEASGLRVRKSATEILEAYMLVGSKKPELLKDKEALNAVTIEAMRLAEAAKMELKDAVAGVTLAMNQYGASAEEAARYVNVLAAGSKFGAVGVATQTESIVKAGVAANMAKVPIEQLVGVLETLGERGIEGQIAGTQLKTFFLKLEAGAKETRPSVVGLQQALETLAAKNLSVTELTKMFGLESISTAQALISSADKVKYYTDAVTGTNTAVEQAAINSDTTAARMAQVRNQINLTGQELAKTLAPILNKTVGWTRRFVMVLPEVIDFIKKYGATTATLLTTLVLYNSYTTIASKVTKAWGTIVAFARTQASGFTAALAAYRTALTGNTLAHVEMTAAVKGTNIATQAGVIVVGLLKAAYYALSLQMHLCARTLKMVKVALAESGFGLAVIAIGAAAAAIMHHNEKMKEARRLAEEQRQAERELYKEYNEAAARIRQLRKTAQDYSATLAERKKAIEELQKLAPEYQASINTEGVLIEKNTQKLDGYLERLKASIVLEAYKSKMTDLLQKQMEAEENQRKASDNYWKLRQQNTLAGGNRTGGILRFFGLDAVHNAEKAKDQADKVLKDIDQEIFDTEQKMKDLAQKWGFSLVDGSGGTGVTDPDTSPTVPPGGNSPSSDQQKRVREAIEAVNAEYDARANDLKQQFLDGQIQTEEEYSKQLQQLELERLNRQLEIAGMEPAQREQIRSKVLDLCIKMKQQLAKLDEQQRKEAEQAATERLNVSRRAMEDALLEMRRTRIEESLTEEEYAERLLQIRRAFYQKALQDQALSDEERQRLQREANELEIQEEERKQKAIQDSREKTQEKYKNNLEEINRITEDFAQAFESTVTALMNHEEDAWKNFGKEILKILINTIEKMALAYMAEVSIKNLAKYGIFGGLAVSAAEIAAIQAAAAGLKGLVSGFSSGGYTGQGRWDEPRGVVHAGEFVANRYAVANDAVRPVLDLIDQAQRNGSIANLTADDIAAVARPSAARAHQAAAHSVSAPGAPARDPELAAAIRLLTRTTAIAAQAYKEPVHAYTFADGRGGVNEAQELLARMKANASRH